MKKLLSILLVAGIVIFVSCGPNAEQIAKQKTQDSIRRADSLEKSRFGTFKDTRDGKTYKTVKIGTQTWMAENLAYKTSGGCWAYNNNEKNIAIYGYLYDWETANKVCPSGWHLPGDAEWTTLTSFLGGDSIAGGKLKEKDTTHWKSPNTGATNETGFTALPGCSRFFLGTFSFIGLGYYGLWWSSTEIDMEIYNHNSHVGRSDEIKSSGLSVRCIKDN
jgi:uncharacterized protein (TIGR02145 family)